MRMLLWCRVRNSAKRNKQCFNNSLLSDWLDQRDYRNLATFLPFSGHLVAPLNIAQSGMIVSSSPEFCVFDIRIGLARNAGMSLQVRPLHSLLAYILSGVRSRNILRWAASLPLFRKTPRSRISAFQLPKLNVLNARYASCNARMHDRLPPAATVPVLSHG